MNDFMLASINALNAQGQTAAATVLENMILNASVTGTVKLADFIEVTSGGATAAATAALDVMQLITTSAMLAAKDHALAIPMTEVTLPNGITSVTASATVIEPAKIIFGPEGVSTSTAQVKLNVTPVINIGTATANTNCTNPLANSSLLSGLLGVLGCLLNPLLPVHVQLNGQFPLDLTVAGATGTLLDIDCDGTPGITVRPTTQAVNLNAAAHLDLDVSILGALALDLASVDISAGALATAPVTDQTFSYPSEFGPSNAKTAGSSTVGLDNLLTIGEANVTVLGILNTAALKSLITSLVKPVLNTVLGGLDDALVAPIAKVLGLRFGGADIAALGMTCNGLRLVQ
jgi:uncharacterized membrane protein